MAGAIALVVAAGLTVRHWPADEAAAGVIAPPPRSVDPSTPESKLLDSVRNTKPIRPEPDDVALRRTTAYFTADTSTALKSKAAEATKRFWATADFVPATDAVWFTDLADRAEAALQE